MLCEQLYRSLGATAHKPKLRMITSFIIHNIGGQARDRFLGHLQEMATIRSSGWLLRKVSNGMPGYLRVSGTNPLKIPKTMLDECFGLSTADRRLSIPRDGAAAQQCYNTADGGVGG